MTYLLNNWHKFLLCALLFVAYCVGMSYLQTSQQYQLTNDSLGQLSDNTGRVREQVQQNANLYNAIPILGFVGFVTVAFLVFAGDLRRGLEAAKKAAGTLAMLVLVCTTGCGWRPYKPVKLEVVKSNEEAFLLPYTGDLKKQESANNEEYLRKLLVFEKQVQIEQQWVQTGFRDYNGHWQDAAILIKVDKSPVTREWTADPNSGTSNKNEAIWVMTSDQVEFSTGWIITARIENRDDAVRFLANYPNGSLEKVLDSEVRGKLQAEFGIEVTDLPMETLRKSATPHIQKTVKSVTDFFKPRGITITNLGISGGFVYKDKSIIDTLVKVFNAEQEKAIASAASAAQEERNKAVVFESTGKADAIMKTKKAEADGIKMLADAKMYELEKAKENLEFYVKLKQLELQRELLHKWDGRYPLYFMGTGGSGNSPNMLLQLPTLDAKK